MALGGIKGRTTIAEKLALHIKIRFTAGLKQQFSPIRQPTAEPEILKWLMLCDAFLVIFPLFILSRIWWIETKIDASAPEDLFGS